MWSSLQSSIIQSLCSSTYRPLLGPKMVVISLFDLIDLIQWLGLQWHDLVQRRNTTSLTVCQIIPVLSYFTSFVIIHVHEKLQCVRNIQHCFEPKFNVWYWRLSSGWRMSYKLRNWFVSENPNSPQFWLNFMACFSWCSLCRFRNLFFFLALFLPITFRFR